MRGFAILGKNSLCFSRGFGFALKTRLSALINPPSDFSAPVAPGPSPVATGIRRLPTANKAGSSTGASFNFPVAPSWGNGLVAVDRDSTTMATASAGGRGPESGSSPWISASAKESSPRIEISPVERRVGGGLKRGSESSKLRVLETGLDIGEE